MWKNVQNHDLKQNIFLTEYALSEYDLSIDIIFIMSLIW